MSTHRVINFPKKPRPLHRLLRTATIGLLISGGVTGVYWQGVHIPRQRSEAMVVQLRELTDSVEQLQALLETRSADLPKAEPSTNAPTKVVDNQPQSYWIAVSGADMSLVPQPLTVEPDASPEATLKTALETLLAGPKQEATNVTTIPEGTRLLGLKISPRGIYIDLSSEFDQGGGSSSMTTRVAQILYTATCLDPDAGVFLSIEGQPLDDAHPLGGEGLLLTQPLTRSQFAKDFPPNLLKSVEEGT